MVRVAIIEDHQVLVDALALLLQKEPDLEFIGSANSFSLGRQLIQERTPDVMLLDLHLPDGNGLDLIPEIQSRIPSTQIVVLTSMSDEQTVIRALDKGVSGFIPKGCSLTELMSAIRKAADGEIVVPSSILAGLLMRLPRDKAAAYREEQGWERLTPREQEVLGCLAKGRSGDEIAAELSIAPLTVRTHIRNLMAKLGVHSRLEAVTFGLQHGLISPPV
jgi:DNA-binding NarL/FixJ family response regulator